MYTGKQGAHDANERSTELNKIDGVQARVGHHRTNGVDHYPVHVVHTGDSRFEHDAYTESGR